MNAPHERLLVKMSMANTPELAPADSDDLIDLQQLISIFRRRLWSFIAAAFVVFVAVVTVTLQATPLYTSTASVVLNLRESQVVDIESVLAGMSSDAAAIETEVEVIRSRAMAEAVVARLDLTAVPEFNGRLREPTLKQNITGAIQSFVSGLLPSQVEQESMVDDSGRARDGAASALMGKRSVRRSGGTYVIEISATSQTPRLARDIANAYADEYLVSQLEAKFEATERANEWLEGAWKFCETRCASESRLLLITEIKRASLTRKAPQWPSSRSQILIASSPFSVRSFQRLAPD